MRQTLTVSLDDFEAACPRFYHPWQSIHAPVYGKFPDYTSSNNEYLGSRGSSLSLAHLPR
jgi:hypothetical protein